MLELSLAWCKGSIATEAIIEFSVHSSESEIAILYLDSCQCNKYCQCSNNIEGKQMTAVWRS